MKKDIEIPEAEGVSLMAVEEFHEELGENVWNIFLWNTGEEALEMVMIVLRGISEDKQTSVMRKTLAELQPGSYARLEFLREELVDFRNEYLITYFKEGKMYEKNFILGAGLITRDLVTSIEGTDMKGILFS